MQMHAKLIQHKNNFRSNTLKRWEITTVDPLKFALAFHFTHQSHDLLRFHHILQKVIIIAVILASQMVKIPCTYYVISYLPKFAPFYAGSKPPGYNTPFTVMSHTTPKAKISPLYKY